MSQFELILVGPARAATAAAWFAEAAFHHLIIRRHLEERTCRLFALDVGQAINVLAHAWIAVLAHHHGLQFRRVPALRNHFNRAVGAAYAGWNCNDRARPFGFDAFDHLLAERFGLDVKGWLMPAALLCQVARWTACR